jgi:hypothetical protein
MPFPPQVAYHVAEAFIAVFDITELSQLFAGHLDTDWRKIITLNPFVGTDQQFMNAVNWLNGRDRLVEAVVAARAERPRSVELMKAEELLGLSASSRIIEPGKKEVTAQTSLEKKVQNVVQAVGIEAFLKRVASADQARPSKAGHSGQNPRILTKQQNHVVAAQTTPTLDIED